MFDVAHVKHDEIFLSEKNISKVTFRNVILTVLL